MGSAYSGAVIRNAPCPAASSGSSASSASSTCRPYGVTGAKATITTHNVKLRCEPFSTFATFSAVWVGPNQTNNAKWAQTGYGYERAAGSTTRNPARTGRYIEVRYGPGANDVYFAGGAIPAAGPHEYRVELDVNTGTWVAYYDGAAWLGSTFQHNNWKCQAAQDVQWVGEIYVLETDMVGTAANKCVFTNCEYRCSGGYFPAGIQAANMISTNRAQWDYDYVSGTSIRIWDVHPQ